MNRQEAAAILREALAAHRAMPFADLVKLIGNVQVTEATGAGGETYTIEIDVMWDARPDGEIRVLGAIDDGRLPGAMAPLCDDFLMTSSGDLH